MKKQEVYEKLEELCPSDYRVNEIIRFSYPYRRIKINATVDKSPEKSIKQLYSVLLKAIRFGYNTNEKLVDFLGLTPDDFILDELYILQEREYVDLVSNSWIVTGEGKNFIADNNILRELKEEEFEFLVDRITGEVLNSFSLSSMPYSEKLSPNSDIDLPHKDSNLITNKYEQLCDAYKKNNQEAHLVDYDKSNILFDKKENHDYWLIEYIPSKEKENEIESYIEIRNCDNGISKDKRLSDILKDRYSSLISDFSESERTSLIALQEDDSQNVLDEFVARKISSDVAEAQILSIWETQEKFIEALTKVKTKILIESPWIKRATSKYIQKIEEALKRNVLVFILYGIESNDKHHPETIKKLEEIKREYPEKFKLIHLPKHFKKIGNEQMTGTHRKLIIKDEDYYILGSFNFLSFNKERGQKIANEESLLISNHVKAKWEKIFDEYEI